MPELIVKPIEVRSILSKSNLPVCEYSVNPYVGCTHGCKYVTNDDSMRRPFEAPPVVVNYFYHEEIKKSARKGAKSRP